MNMSIRRRTPIFGFSLIEMMVALVLGLLVTGSAVGIFTANRRANLSTDALGRIQENQRTAFELMARDVREAGGNACGRNLVPVSVLNNSTVVWWQNFDNPVFGYDNTQAFPDVGFGAGAGQRVNGTDAIEIKAMDAVDVTIVNHVGTAAQFNLTENSGMFPGDIAAACDGRRMAVFQVTGPTSGNTTNLVHNSGGSVVPGNCTQRLGLPSNEDPACSPGVEAYQFQPNARLARFRVARWYIGNNGRGGRSLYSASLRNNAGAASIVNEEIVEGVTDMQLSYLVAGSASYAPATGVAANAWGNVVSVRANLIVQGVGPGVQGTDGAALQRSLAHVITLRNRTL